MTKEMPLGTEISEETSKRDRPYLRVIGDVHGTSTNIENTWPRRRFTIEPNRNMKVYKQLCAEAEYSIQIGDLGYKYDYISDIDQERHRFFMGNHDGYNDPPPKNCLGDFGIIKIPNFPKMFFFRGAFSLDYKHWDNLGLWSPTEQLSQKQGIEALELYAKEKPKIVLSHDCPHNVAKWLTVRRQDGSYFAQEFGYEVDSYGRLKGYNNTGHLLDQAYEIHQPELWIFGHWHRNWCKVVDPAGRAMNVTNKDGKYPRRPCYFRCLGELSYIDFGQVSDETPTPIVP